MNTKIVMMLSALILGIAGIILTFLPAEISALLGFENTKSISLLFQILGALYFGFGMLNWMAKSSLIGGIYNRPIAIANFAHFTIGGLALLKTVFSNPGLSWIFWGTTLVYLFFALIFGWILFHHPAKN
ncbi:MAG TPA: hypothetical protein VFM65_09250 [Flavobacteriaceae bacterium]|nr:hypothetical protein [Flavobacteriaceae bacterium]